MFNDMASNIGTSNGTSVQTELDELQVGLDSKAAAAPVIAAGAIGDGVANDTAPIAASLAQSAHRTIELPLSGGKYRTGSSFYSYPNSRFSGEGTLVIGNIEQARNRSSITNEVSDPDYDYENYFGGDWSKQLSTNFTIIGEDVGKTPIAQYRLLDRAAQIASIYVNAGGINTVANNQSGGRTGVFRESVRLIQGGQGDCMGRFTFAQAYSARTGATHFLACPAVSLEAADIEGLADGNYLQAYEFNFKDVNGSVAVGNVMNYARTKRATALEQTWKHDLVNSRGTEPIDVVYQMFGRSRRYIDVTSATLTDGSVIAMKAGQRIHFKATENLDSIGMNKGANVTETWIGYQDGSLIISLDIGDKISIKNQEGTFTADPSIWKIPALQNGWVPHVAQGQAAPMYRRNMAGQVELKGHARGGALNTLAYQLPIGFRPSKRMFFVTLTAFGPSHIVVDSDGVVYVVFPADGSGVKHISLDGISFSIDN